MPRGLHTPCKDREENLTSLKCEKDGIRIKLIDLESQSMRKKVMFYGIQEERCKHLVKQFCNEQLSIGASSMTLDCFHLVSEDSARTPVQ